MKREYLNTTQAADLLGVAATTVKRWADEDVLSCVRTRGGHRRFTRQDVEQFLVQRAGLGRGTASVDTWVNLLIAEDSTHRIVSALLEERARRGSWASVAVFLGSVLVELGERWVAADLTIMQEHEASNRLARGLATVVSTLPLASGAPRCVLATAEGDDHTLGLALAELVCVEAGWACQWSGARTPTDELVATIQSGAVQAVALSASPFSSNPETLATQAEILAAACNRYGVALVLGGNGAWPPVNGGTHRVFDFEELQRVLTELLGTARN